MDRHKQRVPCTVAPLFCVAYIASLPWPFAEFSLYFKAVQFAGETTCICLEQDLCYELPALHEHDGLYV